MKVTHTHRGHCQLCVSVQAIDPESGRIAKHGYTVEFGYFNGTCPGSGLFSLHVERKYADESIAEARARAKELNKLAKKYVAGTKHPACVWNGTYREVPAPTRRWANRTVKERVMVLFADAPKTYQLQGIEDAVYDLRQRASSATRHADELQKWADRITGKVDAYRVSDLEPAEWKVGDTIRLGGQGRHGFDAKIEAIEDRPYQTRGWRVGSGAIMVPHARVTRPARPARVTKDGYEVDPARPAKELWEPLRNIKRSPTPLAERLKKEGVL